MTATLTTVGAGGDVTALSVSTGAGHPAAVLVGIGSQLHVLDVATGRRTACATVLPDGARVHGVVVEGATTAAAAADAVLSSPVAPTPVTLCVHGDRFVETWSLDDGGSSSTAALTPLAAWRAHSWVHAAAWLPGGALAIGTADNAVTIVDTSGGRAGDDGGAAQAPPTRRSPWPTARWRCDAQRGSLYSMALAVVGTTVHVAAGTAFLEVVVWRCNAAPPRTASAVAPAAVLTGHTGSIHRVAWAPPTVHGGDLLLASASDDRSVRLWRVRRGGGAGADGGANAAAASVATYAGHGARLWDVAFVGADLGPASTAAAPAYVVSACEDGAARAWAVTGGPATPATTATPAATLRGHTGRGVWRVAAVIGGLIVTAGADGSALAWRLADFLDDGWCPPAPATLAWPVDSGRAPGPLAVSCLAASALPGELLVGARDGRVWRVALGTDPPRWRTVAPPSLDCGPVVALASAPCPRCRGDGNGRGVLILAGCGRGWAVASCDCADGAAPLRWPAAPVTPSGDVADRLPPVARVFLPADLGGRVAVTASTLGDVRLWRVGCGNDDSNGDDAHPPLLLAAAPPRRSRRRDASVVAVAACGVRRLLYVADAAGGVSVYRLPADDGGRRDALTDLDLVCRTTTPHATAATCLSVGPGVSPPPLLLARGGRAAPPPPPPPRARCCGEVRVADAAGRVTAFAVGPDGELARCGGDRLPFPVVTFDGALTPGSARVVAGFRGDTWCTAAPRRGGGAECVRERGTGGWRRPTALVPGGGEGGPPPTLVWCALDRAAAAAGLAARPLAGAAAGPPPALELPAGHGLEALAAVWLPSPPSGGDAPPILVTVGEDGALVTTRVAPAAAPAGLAAPSAAAGGLLDGASLRGVAAIATPLSSAPPGTDWLLFAAGSGGGAVTAWRAWWPPGGNKPAPTPTTAWAACSSTAKRGHARVAAAVPRAMGVVAVEWTGCQRGDDGSGGRGRDPLVGVFVALSTGSVVAHAFDAAAGAFVGRPVVMANTHAGAALCVAAADGAHGGAVVVSGGTDGRVVARRAGGALARTIDADGAPATWDDGSSRCVVSGQHASGVLAVSAARAAGGARVVVATAGDDQAVAVAFLAADPLACVGTAVVRCAHVSAVRGVWTDGGRVVSVSLDRTLAAWRVGAGDARDGDGRGAVVGPLWTRRVQVPAPAGVAVTAVGGGRMVVVVGRGCEVIVESGG